MCVLLDEIIGNAYEIFFAQSTDKDRTEDDVLYCSGFISHHQAGFAAIEFSLLYPLIRSSGQLFRLPFRVFFSS